MHCHGTTAATANATATSLLPPPLELITTTCHWTASFHQPHLSTCHHNNNNDVQLRLTHKNNNKCRGHWVSKDFLHWTRLPVAIWNDQWYDAVAIFSGSTTIVDGQPVIVCECMLRALVAAPYLSLSHAHRTLHTTTLIPASHRRARAPHKHTHARARVCVFVWSACTAVAGGYEGRGMQCAMRV